MQFMITLRFITLLFLFVILYISNLPLTSAQEQPTLVPNDECDWIGSGGGGRGVRPVYLRCSRGSILWRYPRGALRIVLSLSASVVTATPFMNDEATGSRIDGTTAATTTAITTMTTTYARTNASGSGSNTRLGNFRVCVKVSGPARVYLETHGVLRPVYSPRDGKHEASHRCFHSNKQRTALYVEADELSFDNKRARLQYDVEPFVINRDGSAPIDSNEDAECRPCSMEELAKAYCQSDLVARGTVSAVEKKLDLNAAELVFRITKTLRKIEESEVNEVFPTLSNSRVEKEVRVRVPIACDARHGQGEFVIMARRRLGDFTIVCVPRLETWAEAVRELVSAPCLLKS